MPRIPVEVYAITNLTKENGGEVSVFYLPTGNFSHIRPIHVNYPLDVFPLAAKLETGMRKAITVHEEHLRKLQF